MTRFLPARTMFLFITGLCLAQTPAQSPSNAATAPQAQKMRFNPGSTIRAELDKTIDAKKVNAGDPVLAKTVDELRAGTEVIAPAGAKILGHVVAASAHEKDAPSRLEIAFDKLELPNGSDVDLKASIQAMAKPVANVPMASDSMEQPSAPNAPTGSSGRTGGMPAGGMGQQPAGSQGSVNPGPMPGTPAQTPAAASALPLNAQGVMGMSGVSLSAGPAQDSVITSEKHNVKLENGTQMILRVE
jgi:hypothetical protein